jgi:hypothetical protein
MEIVEIEENEGPQDPIVTSGESDEGVLGSDDEEDEGFGRAEKEEDANGHQQEDALYDANADEEDAEYVYNYLRSGAADPKTTQSSKSNDKIVKPRNSDAVLSCPCCLACVTMDTQKHERYANQYRAMFVMNIMVRWDVRLRYDTTHSQLVPLEGSTPSQELQQVEGTAAAESPRVVEDHTVEENTKEDDTIYYKVCVYKMVID